MDRRQPGLEQVGTDPFFVPRPVVLREVADLSSEFGGADDQVKDVVAEINPEYKPWFEAIWSPPSAEVESILFALQAAAGAGFIGYWIGFQRGRRSTRTA